MIEKTVLDYLKTKLAPVPVVMERPKATVIPFVLIEKTGGGEADHIRSATFAIQSYAASMYAAASLSETVETAMKGITELNEISACKVNASGYNFTDTTEKRYRYQAVFNIFY